MDTQQLISQFMSSAADNPELLKTLGVDPAAAIENATGFKPNDEELEDILGAVAPMLQGEGLNMDKVQELVGDLIGDAGILGKLGGPFGGK